MGFFKNLVQKITPHKGKIEVLWSFKAGSAITTNPTCMDINKDGFEEIIFGTKDGRIICLSHEGKKLWEFDAKQKIEGKMAIFLDKEVVQSIYSQPIVMNLHHDEQGIVFGTESGLVICLDHNGKKKWEFKTKGGVRGAPATFDMDNDGVDEIVFGSRDQNLYALNAKGKEIWKYQAASPIESSAALCQGKKRHIIFGCNNGDIVSVNTDGSKKWVYSTGGRVHAQPAIADVLNKGVQHIIVGSEDGHLYVLDEEGVLQWNYRTHGRIISRVMLSDVDKDKELEFFFGAFDDQVHALAANSQTMWTYETGFWIGAPVYVTDVDGNGTVEVVAGSFDKHVYVLEAMGSLSLDYMPGISGVVQQSGNYSDIMTSEPGKLIGKVIWKCNVGESIISMAILHEDTHRQIVVGTKEGSIHCLHHTH